MHHLLPILLLVPLAGAALCLVLPVRAAKWLALFTSLLALALVLPLADVALGSGRALAWAPERLIVHGLGTGVRLGCDSVSWWLILLTAFLQPLATLGSYGGIHARQKSYYFWLTALLTPMIGTFLARDGLLFYVFFELTLVPMFFLIGIWGGEERNYAAKKFFLFTFVGGVFTLAAVLYLGLTAGSFGFEQMTIHGQSIGDPKLKVILFLALMLGFAVKIPLFPFHTWLPLAHTVAPTAGSVILAGVLLKLGTYGVLKLGIPMGLLSSLSVSGVDGNGLLPVMRDSVIPWLGLLCVIGIIYGALVAWVQQDIKKLVAYSSVSHLGFCVLGLIALNATGIQGGVFYMISHGISTGALFLLVGMLYDRYHTRMFRDYSGMGRVMPVFAAFLVLFTMSSIGLPGTNGFISEFLTILGAFTSPLLGPVVGAFAAIGVILGAVYMLYMVGRVLFGPLKVPEVHTPAPAGEHAFAEPPADGAPEAQLAGEEALPSDASATTFLEMKPALPRDLSGREIALLTPLAIVVLVLGVLPMPVLSSVLPGVDAARLPGVQTLELQVPPAPPPVAQGGNVAAEVAPDIPPEDAVPPPE